jgi:hypothetical protein
MGQSYKNKAQYPWVFGTNQYDKREDYHEKQWAGMEWIGENFDQPFPEGVNNISGPKPTAFLIALGAEIEIRIGV